MSNFQVSLEEAGAEAMLRDDVETLRYEQIDRRYRSVQMALTALLYLLFAALALVLLAFDDRLWLIIGESIVGVAFIVNMFIVQKAWRFKGYALREFDISYRSGVIFPKITTVPFNRLQQVSIKQNPISKLFKLYAVEVVNGAQAMASLSIPGLTEERANQIKSIVINKLKNEND